MEEKHTLREWRKWYAQKMKKLDEAYENVTPLAFYRDLFPEGCLQTSDGKEDGKGNAMVDVIVSYGFTDETKSKEKRYCRKYIMHDDLDALKRMYKPDNAFKEQSRLCLCSPVSYFGKKKSNKMAHELFAVVLDLDYVGLQQLKNIIKQIGNGARTMPPNYIVNSGKGLHLYYLLEEPIPCYEYMIEQLTAFKKVLEAFIWNETTSLKPEKPDAGAITQAFRMVGSETKLGEDYVVEAYKVREERWTIEELYYWVNQRAPSFLKDCPMPELREPIEVYRKRHPLSLEEAKQKYPDWDPEHPGRKWTCKPDLYHWWIRQIKDKAIVGGRYYALLALAAYGSKCDIPFEQIQSDALSLVPYLETLTDDETNHFTQSDAMDAMSFYKNNKQEVTYRLTRQRISELTKIDIPANKRNGRKQEQHIRMVNVIRKTRRDVLGEDEYRNNGRPDKAEIVKDWQKAHPNGKKIDCERETGLSRHTVIKWWNT